MHNQRIIRKWLTITVLSLVGLFSASGAWAQTYLNFPGVGTYTKLQIKAHSWYIGGAITGTPGSNGKAVNYLADPGKQWKIQSAGVNIYNIINLTDGRCLAAGDGVYEVNRVLPDAGQSSLDYLMELTTCTYTDPQVQWFIEDHGTGVQFRSVSAPTKCAQENDSSGGQWLWVKSFPSCGGGNPAVIINLMGYTPASAKPPVIFRREMY